MPEARSPCLSPLGIDKILRHRNSVTPADSHLLEHVSACPSCTHRLDEAAALDAHFQAVVVPRTLPELLGGPLRRPWFKRPMQLSVAAACCVVAVAALLVTVWDHSPTVGPGQTVAHKRASQRHTHWPEANYVGTKSSVALLLHVRRDGAVFQLEDGMTVSPGDLIRLEPVAGDLRYVLALYRDHSGNIQVVFPWNGTKSGPVPKGGEPLEGSLRLDRNLGQEQVVALFSSTPIAAPAAIEWALAQEQTLESGKQQIDGQQVESVVVRLLKESR